MNTFFNRFWFTKYAVALIIVAMLLSGCSERGHDRQLEQINRLSDTHPDSAKKLLDSINPELLDSRDRHYLDFLTVKADDRNYKRHTSDSLILDYLKYVERHEPANVTSEAYYYAGRVYSDLNDYPDAIKYYHKALDRLPEDSLNGRLHYRILSQTGKLLCDMRLQREAIRYLSQVNWILRSKNDSVSLVHNLHMLRIAHLRLKNADSAKMYASQALRLCPADNRHLKAKSRMLLAEVYYIMGNTDSALKLIRHAPEQVKPISRNAALSIAADIYQSANINDTAWMYTRQLIASEDTLNKRNGYRLILSSSLADELPRDSVRKYLVAYHDILEDFYNRNNAEEATLQHTVYNYDRHDRARKAAERESRHRLVWIAGFAIVTVFLLLISLALYERQRRSRAELKMAGVRIAELQDQMRHAAPVDKTREELVDVLRTTYGSGLKVKLDQGILNSPEYAEIKRRIGENSTMVDTDDYWADMDRMVTAAHPKLKETLELLTVDRLTDLDWHICIMVKCKISQVEMARLLCVTRSAVTHRLKAVSRKVFDDKGSAKMITGAVMLIN